MTLVLTGLDIEEKAAWAEQELFGILGGREQFADVDVRLLRFDRPDAPTNEQATAHLRITVKDPDPRKVGRRFSNATMELALGGYAGFHTTTPPTPESAYGVYWPALVPAAVVASCGGAPGRHHRAGRPHGTAAALPPRRTPAAGRSPSSALARGRPSSRWSPPAGPDLRRPLRRQGRQRQHRALDPDPAAYPGCATTSPSTGCGRCCPSPPDSTSAASSCPTCTRSTSSSSACSARAWRPRPGPTRRPRASASTCAPASRKYRPPCWNGAQAPRVPAGPCRPSGPSAGPAAEGSPPAAADPPRGRRAGRGAWLPRGRHGGHRRGRGHHRIGDLPALRREVRGARRDVRPRDRRPVRRGQRDRRLRRRRPRHAAGAHPDAGALRAPGPDAGAGLPQRGRQPSRRGPAPAAPQAAPVHRGVGPRPGAAPAGRRRRDGAGSRACVRRRHPVRALLLQRPGR